MQEKFRRLINDATEPHMRSSLLLISACRARILELEKMKQSEVSALLQKKHLSFAPDEVMGLAFSKDGVHSEGDLGFYFD